MLSKIFLQKIHDRQMSSNSITVGSEMSIAAAAAAGFLKFIAAAADFLKIHRGSIFFENIEKVHEFDRILVFTSETS
jgi:hypothetical protein